MIPKSNADRQKVLLVCSPAENGSGFYLEAYGTDAVDVRFVNRLVAQTPEAERKVDELLELHLPISYRRIYNQMHRLTSFFAFPRSVVSYAQSGIGQKFVRACLSATTGGAA